MTKRTKALMLALEATDGMRPPVTRIDVTYGLGNKNIIGFCRGQYWFPVEIRELQVNTLINIRDLFKARYEDCVVSGLNSR